eukprot:TRINITY_DN22037_c0_g1_i1.p1 TRINITY_DN22037_c0_g1~~TRINITY_DN22037_c0_g1_i1.p1  ORF type:complete len:344 (-),score=59.84 TRINITY_DN22037_c0_g1_i1:13-1044(-)
MGLLGLGFQFGSWEAFQKMVKKNEEFVEFLSQYNLRQFGQDEYLKVVELRNKYNLYKDSSVKKIDEDFGKLLSWMYILIEQREVDTKLQRILQSLVMINEECGRMQDIVASKESAINDLTQKVIVLNKYFIECNNKFNIFVDAIQQIKECKNNKTEARARETLQDSRIIVQSTCCLMGINIDSELQKVEPELPVETQKSAIRKSFPLEAPKPIEDVVVDSENVCDDEKKEEPLPKTEPPVREQEIVPEIIKEIFTPLPNHRRANSEFKPKHETKKKSNCMCACNQKLHFISYNSLIQKLSLIHISEPTRPLYISYAVFCLKKKKKTQYRPKTKRTNRSDKPLH